MNRRTKWVLGVTVALITAASLRITVGHHHHWRGYRHHAEDHQQCESHWHKHGHQGTEKPQTESQKNQ